MTHMAIAEMAKMAILVNMATILMANGNFIMAIRGIQLKSIKNSSVMLNLYELDFLFRRYQKFCDFVNFTPFLQCKNCDTLKPILQKLLHLMTNNF